MKAVDLFTGEGGWAAGLADAGFDVTGYDIRDRPATYPSSCNYERRDVLTLTAAELAGSVAIAASPPCQGVSLVNPQVHRGERPNEQDMALFHKTAELIRDVEPLFWVVENVRGALRHFLPIWGKPRLRYGAFFLWGNFPAFMVERSNAPMKYGGNRWNTSGRTQKVPYRAAHKTAKVPIELSRPLFRAIAQEVGA